MGVSICQVNQQQQQAHREGKLKKTTAKTEPFLPITLSRFKEQTNKQKKHKTTVTIQRSRFIKKQKYELLHMREREGERDSGVRDLNGHRKSLG